MKIRFHTVFMSPKVDYILATSLFVCIAFLSQSKHHTLSLQNEVIGHIMELSGGGRFFLIENCDSVEPELPLPINDFLLSKNL